MPLSLSSSWFPLFCKILNVTLLLLLFSREEFAYSVNNFVCPEPSGKYGVEEDCRLYYVCTENKAVLTKCPENYSFHSQWLDCVYEGRASIQQSTRVSSQCCSEGPCGCGQVDDADKDDPRKGTPWLVAIFQRDRNGYDDWEFVSPGAILGPTTVITTCRLGRMINGRWRTSVNASSYHVLAGAESLDENSVDEFAQRAEVSLIQINPKNKFTDFCSAMVHLKEPLRLNTPYVRPVCLPIFPKPPNSSQTQDGKKDKNDSSARRSFGYYGTALISNYAEKLNSDGFAHINSKRAQLTSQEFCFAHTYKYNSYCAVSPVGGDKISEICMAHQTITVAQVPNDKRWYLLGFGSNYNNDVCGIRKIDEDNDGFKWILYGIKCGPYQYPCGNGQCVGTDLLCDQRQDCPGNEDEDPKLCRALNPCINEATFECGVYENCVLPKKVCDGFPDCWDSADEKVDNCKYTKRKNIVPFYITSSTTPTPMETSTELLMRYEAQPQQQPQQTQYHIFNIIPNTSPLLLNSNLNPSAGAGTGVATGTGTVSGTATGTETGTGTGTGTGTSLLLNSNPTSNLVTLNSNLNPSSNTASAPNTHLLLITPNTNANPNQNPSVTLNQDQDSSVSTNPNPSGTVIVNPKPDALSLMMLATPEPITPVVPPVQQEHQQQQQPQVSQEQQQQAQESSSPAPTVATRISQFGSGSSGTSSTSSSSAASSSATTTPKSNSKEGSSNNNNHPSGTGTGSSSTENGFGLDENDLSNYLLITTTTTEPTTTTTTTTPAPANTTAVQSLVRTKKCPPIDVNEGIALTCVSNVGGTEFKSDCSEDSDVGTVATFRCKNYYKPAISTEESHVKKCTEDLHWKPSRYYECVPDCGRLPNSNAAYIVNGQSLTSRDRFPWHAALYYNRRNKFEYICGATLIRQSFVLTAAHCVTDFNGDNNKLAESFKVILAPASSDYEKNLNDSSAQIFDVRKIVVNPHYDPSNNYQSDIAILALSRPCEIGDNVMLACIPNMEIGDPPSGVIGKSVGFGIDETGKVSQELKFANLPIVKIDECIKGVHFIPSVNQFCAGYTNGTGVCFGDSGGGFVVLHVHSQRYYLHGIVSVGPRVDRKRRSRAVALNCDHHTYSVFTDVSRFVEWINEEINMMEMELK